MQRYKLTIEYDGTNFSGWQKQENAPTIQQSLEEAVAKFCQQDIEIFGSGRTDAGVHALGQVAHIDLPKDYDEYTVENAINKLVQPHPIIILKAEKTDDDFHARFSATYREYIYRIINRRPSLTVDRNYAWHIRENLDIAKMNEAAQYLIGKHDFTSFRATACQAKDPIKTLDLVEVTKTGHEIQIKVGARSFLHHMVRNIAGTLRLVGNGKWQPEDVQKALEAKSRPAAGVNAPAHALYLMEIKY